MVKRAKHTRPPGFSAERAKFWRVSLRVMQIWLRSNLPVESTEKMIAWYASLPAAKQMKISPKFQRRVTELRLQRDGGANNPAGDPEFTIFEKEYSEGKINDQTALADLKKQFAFYQFKQRQCSARNDAAGASDAMRQVRELGSVIHDMELRAQKLGRDLGDLVPRGSLEEPARRIGYHLMRCADASIEECIAALTRRDPTGAPLLAEEIRPLIEPILLNAFVLQPIIRAADGDNSGAPPDWLVSAIRSGAAEVLEEVTLDRMAAPAVPA